MNYKKDNRENVEFSDGLAYADMNNSLQLWVASVIMIRKDRKHIHTSAI